MKTTIKIALIGFALFISNSAFAGETYDLGFTQQSGVACNEPGNCALGETLLDLTVTDNMDGTVTFKYFGLRS